MLQLVEKVSRAAQMAGRSIEMWLGLTGRRKQEGGETHDR